MGSTITLVLFAALLVSANGSPSLNAGIPSGDSNPINAMAAEAQKQGRDASDRLAVSSLTKRANYVGCSDNYQIQILEAVQVAQAYATSSYNYLKSNPSGSNRYTKWFGPYEPDRYNTVLKSFDHLRKQLDKWTYSCACAEGKPIVKVNRDQYGIVNLCPNFWVVPAEGVYSRAFSIIQGGTQFSEVLGANERAFTLRDSTALAKMSPKRAVYNANNYAYFSVAAHARTASTKGHLVPTKPNLAKSRPNVPMAPVRKFQKGEPPRGRRGSAGGRAK